jgi:hypothetical protein
MLTDGRGYFSYGANFFAVGGPHDRARTEGEEAKRGADTPPIVGRRLILVRPVPQCLLGDDGGVDRATIPPWD